MSDRYLLSMKVEVIAEEQELREFIKAFTHKFRIIKGMPQIRHRRYET